MANIQTNTRNSYYAILVLTEQSQSNAANSTTLAYALTLYNGAPHFSGYTIGYRVKIDGKQVAYHDNRGAQTSMDRYSSKLVVSGEATVLHNDDGKKTVAVDVEIWTDTNQYLPTYISGSETVELTQILRESTISATDANIGAVSMIAVNRKSSGYTHSIAYRFGTVTGYITANGGASDSEVKLSDVYIGWTVPTAFYASIPNDKSGECTLTCKTYSGDTQIGGIKTCIIRCTAAESLCAPTVTGTVVDTNEAVTALTGSASKLVRYISDALCTISAAAKNGAAIKQRRIAGQAATDTTRTISAMELDAVTFDATDSRGYLGAVTVPVDLVPYIKLTCRATSTRLTPTGDKVQLNISGSYYNGSFGAAANSLSVKYKVDNASGWTEAAPTISGNAYTVQVELSGISYNATHAIAIMAADKLSAVQVNDTIKRGVPVFDWGEHDMEMHIPVVSPAASLALDGGTDAAGYVRVAAIKIIGKYVNTPITMAVSRRADNAIHQIVLRFAASETTDPNLELLTVTGSMDVFADRISAGMWEVYAAKIGTLDVLSVLDLRYNLAYLAERLLIDVNSGDYLASVPSDAITATQIGDVTLETLGGLPLHGGEMVSDDGGNGSIGFPGVDSSFRLGRDNAAVRVKNPNGSIGYVPALSAKGKNCSWEIAVYDDELYLTNIADASYDAGTNAPQKYFVLSPDGIWHLQDWKLVVNGSLSADATLSGSASQVIYKTVHVLFGTAISGTNYYISYSFAFSDDYWNIYLPAAGDYFRAKATVSGSTISVQMLSEGVTRWCYVYVSI